MDYIWIGFALILAIDPGKATGIVFGTPDKYENKIIDYPEIYDTLYELVVQNDWEAVVIENFLISGQTAKKTQAPWSLKLIGWVEGLCYQRGFAPILQTPSEAKNFITDDKLKKWGMWIKGEGHDRDALKHMLLWYFRNKPGETIEYLQTREL